MGRLRQAADSGAQAARGVGMRAHLEDVLPVRSAAPTAVDVFGFRRAYKIARLSVDDVRADTEAGAADLMVNHQENDQYRFGQLLGVRPWSGACPVRLPSGWICFPVWIGRHRGHLKRMSGDPMAPLGNSVPNALFAGLIPCKFGLGAALAGVAAA